ncbi:MAG TPA: prepilin-type N-terminal cleavage/methylation domain-containing protein [Candidatus Sulfotelmatobacter sp.]|nr:prepilin-type N-terminal cleavage/methylation domain-containing protein [Candidatus Sulfotelmatobacter sp.]
MKNIFKKQTGFTLIELLIFMGIFSILILSMFQLLTSIFDVQLESQSTSVVSQDGRFILNRLTYDIKNSTSVTTPGVGNQGQTLAVYDGVKTFTYRLSNGNLTLTNSLTGATDQLNSFNTSVSNLNFLTLSDNGSGSETVTISFTINSKVTRRGGINTENFTMTQGTR